jgi:hypothetical protein
MGGSAAPVDGVPDWVWSFRLNRWASARRAAGEPVDLTRFVRERDRWRKERDAWLAERGLVMEDMRGMPSGEFKRIEREEPHRILRRPDA